MLCTTKLAQSTSQYYFVLQSLHKALPSTTLYYKACTNYFPVLLCASFVVQSSTGKCFVLQSLHKALPSTTLYYKACTKHFPVLLCTTKLAQTTSQYYFALQSLHKTLPSTTLYTIELRATASEIAAPKPDLDAKAEKRQFWSIFKSKNYWRQNCENLLTNHYRSLDAATPIRFTIFSCKRQEYYASSRSTKQHSCSHSNAICKHKFKNT